MKTMKTAVISLISVVLVSVLSGCAVRSYTVEQPRSDLELSSGNRGYIGGKAAPSNLPREVKDTTRTVRVTEIELPGILKPRSRAQLQAQGATPVQSQSGPVVIESTPVVSQPAAQSFVEYTVASGDNLEKIAKKFYGKPTQWKQIFEANKDILKSPDKLRVGQVLRIPQEGAKPAPAREAVPPHAK